MGTALALLLSPHLQAQESTASVASAAVLPDSPGYIQTTASSAGQGSASISGIISDVSGAIVPGATVSILGSDDKPLRSATADSEGHFSLDGLAPGTYKLLVSAPGLESFRPPDAVLKEDEHYILPETALPIATANQSIDVVLTQSMIADQELADETKQRVLAIFPNFYTSYEWNAAPMNTRQKFKLTFRATTDPISFATAAIVAGIEQERNTFPDYGQGAQGYGKRFGAAYGDALIGRFIGTAILPSIFRQDPRYFYMGPEHSSTSRRLRHALAFSVTARSDRGHTGHLMPNYSHILGNFLAGYISKTYHPGTTSALTLGGSNVLIGIAGGAVQGLTREFIFRRISTHTPPYAKGRPAALEPYAEPTKSKPVPPASPAP